MPRITKNKLGAAGWSAVDYDGRLYTPARMSQERCTVCRMQLVDVLAEAGETTHPACAGWPPGRTANSGRSACTPDRRRGATRGRHVSCERQSRQA